MFDCKEAKKKLEEENFEPKIKQMYLKDLKEAAEYDYVFQCLQEEEG